MTGTVDATGLDPFADVVGQEAAVAELRAALADPVHAYLLVGPPGSGTRPAARAFAAALLSAGSDADAAARHVRLALGEAHPDLHVVEATTADGRIDVTTARAVVADAARSPTEGARKVIVLEDLHLMGPFAAMLLKHIEEPPASTIFVLLAETVPPEMATIASRAVRIELGPVPTAVVAERLVAEGVDPEQARAVAVAAGGDLDRARLLATDDRFGVRDAALRAVPGRLDGTGARAAELAAEISAMIDDAQAAIDQRHAEERAEMEERVERYGDRGSGRRDQEARHKREVRRHRTAELRFALATLAGVYRDALATADDPAPLAAALDRIDAAALALDRFPNETLLVQALLAQLPPVAQPLGASRATG